MPDRFLQRVQQHFDQAPYPPIPLTESVQYLYGKLYCHNLLTPFYLHYRQLPDPSEKLILDAGCGTGYSTLLLAEANPGAKIVAVDLSLPSLAIAQQRLQYHGFTNIEFQCLSIETLPQLGLKFDYINSDEVLYYLEDAVAGLQAMQSVLKPQGIIRANFHSALQRDHFFRCQACFALLGLMDSPAGEAEIDKARAVMGVIKDQTVLKTAVWKPDFNFETDANAVRWNCLNYGDRGTTIPEIFVMLQQASLAFISMVEWRQWQVTHLFETAATLPQFLAQRLQTMPLAEQLHLIELVNPTHRLLDFWCGHPSAKESISLVDGIERDWRQVRIRLHPQLQTDFMQNYLMQCVQQQHPFNISLPFSGMVTDSLLVPYQWAASLRSLWQGSQSIQTLIEQCRVNHSQMGSVGEEFPIEQIKQLLADLESNLYVLMTDEQ